MTLPENGSDPVEGVIRAYRAALPDGEVDAFDISGVDRTGVPVVAADFRGRGSDPEPPFGSFGYGSTQPEARRAAFGELAESVLQTAALRRLSPRAASFTEAGRSAIDPRLLGLPAGSGWTPEQPLHWLPMTRWRTGEQVLVPAEFVASRGYDVPLVTDPLITPITNGLGAGDTLERAVSHGLLELVQRDGNTVSFRALEQGVVLDLGNDVAHPPTVALLDRFAAAGIKVSARLATTEFVPVVHVVGRDTRADAPPLVVTASGEGAHPDREVALYKAVCEYASSRARKVFAHAPLAEVARVAPADYLARQLAEPVPPQEERALAAMRAWAGLSAAELTDVLADSVLRETSSVAFSSVPTVGGVTDPADLLPHLLDRLAAFDVLVFAAGFVGGGCGAVKVLVPGLEVETLSYGRVGPRVLRRLLERDSPLVGLGPADREGLLPLVLPPDAELGPAWFDRAEADRVVGPLYPLYREPTRHAIARLS